MCPTDSYTKRELIECARSVTEKVRGFPLGKMDITIVPALVGTKPKFLQLKQLSPSPPWPFSARMVFQSLL